MIQSNLEQNWILPIDLSIVILPSLASIMFKSCFANKIQGEDIAHEKCITDINWTGFEQAKAMSEE